MIKILCARCGKTISRKYGADTRKTSRRRRYFICDECDLERMIEITQAAMPEMMKLDWTAGLLKHAQGYVFQVHGIDFAKHEAK